MSSAKSMPAMSMAPAGAPAEVIAAAGKASGPSTSPRIPRTGRRLRRADQSFITLHVSHSEPLGKPDPHHKARSTRFTVVSKTSAGKAETAGRARSRRSMTGPQTQIGVNEQSELVVISAATAASILP